jgi:hypothetical protein
LVDPHEIHGVEVDKPCVYSSPGRKHRVDTKAWLRYARLLLTTSALSASNSSISAIDTPEIERKGSRVSCAYAIRHSLTLIAFSAFLLTVLWFAIAHQIRHISSKIQAGK